MPYKSIFKPNNPQKYVGKNLSSIIARSNLERVFMKWLDNNPDVIEWCSETIKIPYKNPIKEIKGDKREINATYYPDFYMKYKNKNGDIEQALIEVKMREETQPPRVPKKMSRVYKAKVATYMINEAKWKAAKAVCEKVGNIKFMIITEDYIKNLCV